MRWFKKWSTEKSESQNKSGEEVESKSTACDHVNSIKTNSIKNVSYNINDNTNEPSCSGIKLYDPKAEILHPDEFFQDPEHIRQYKEEAEFLNMISEWEIINFTDIPASYYHLNTRQACQKKQSKKKKKKKKAACEEKQIRSRSSPSTSSAVDCPLLLPTTPKVMKDIKPVGILTKSKDEELYISNDDDFVQIKRTPSVLSLTSYNEDEYGLFESPYTVPEDQPPEAIYPGFLWNDVQPGLRIKASNVYVQNPKPNQLLEASIINSLQNNEDHLKTEGGSKLNPSVTIIDSLQTVENHQKTENGSEPKLLMMIIDPLRSGEDHLKTEDGSELKPSVMIIDHLNTEDGSESKCLMRIIDPIQTDEDHLKAKDGPETDEDHLNTSARSDPKLPTTITDPLQTIEDHLKIVDLGEPKHPMTNLGLSNKSNSISNISDIDDKSSTINAISMSLMGALMTPNSILSNIKSYNITEDDNNDTSSSVNDTKNNSKTFSLNTKKTTIHDINVAKLFSLNDDGDISINMNHINIDYGCGFLKRCNKNVYKIIKFGVEIDENYKTKRSSVNFLKCLIRFIRDVLFGHPRNKSQSGGPGDSVGSYTLQLANDHTSTFSRNIENFIACTKESREAAPQVVMRNMRQFMSGMKNYLVKHGEGDFQQEVQKARSRLKPDEFLNLDAILEAVMHQLVVLPLREHLYGMFVDYYTRSGDIQLLVENVKYACARNPADFGIQPSVTPPTSMALHQISLLLLRLQEAELPLEKLELFLLVISAIFDATGCPRGQQLGADDFLPILVFVVAKCGFVGAEIEAEFMWGLLQPPLLSGEAGYYLTALCSAVHVLKSFMASDSEGTGSLDWRSSSLPACSSVLRVIIPDECNGSLQTRTLPVRPHTTTREVCRIIAHRARITNPQDYGLFKLVDGEETLLADSECPQDARIAARGKHCMLAYKRIDAKIAWPTSTTATYS